MLENTLVKWGYEVIVTADGTQAWATLQREDAPTVAILDWMMPSMDGTEVCRNVRQAPGTTPTYIILLTIKSSKEEIAAGLDAGADGYLTMPFDRAELRACKSDCA